MNVLTKLSLYGLTVIAVFGMTLGLGHVVGHVGSAAEDEPAAVEHEMDSHGDHDVGSGRNTDASNAEQLPAGLTVSWRGYRLALATDAAPAGTQVPLSFRIVGPTGTAVTAFQKTHDKDLHLIVVRRDLTGFQHVHPIRDDAGTWRTKLSLTPGEWRVFADFAVAGEDEGLTLGADLSVSGNYQAANLPRPSTTAKVDGYTVTMDGELTAGEQSELAFSVARGGKPITNLEPYLAAYGHLVVLRDGDLAYLHVHPAGGAGEGTKPGSSVAFSATAASVGTYRLFLDFKHGGVVRTAEFTVHVGDADQSHHEMRQ
jgi:hypothetical protein